MQQPEQNSLTTTIIEPLMDVRVNHHSVEFARGSMETYELEFHTRDEVFHVYFTEDQWLAFEEMVGNARFEHD